MSQLNPRKNRGRTVLLTVVAVAACAAGLIGYLLAEPQASTDRFYIRNGGGAVVFEHAGHQQAVDGCQYCHHEMVTGGGDCSECHDDPDYAAGMLEHAELLEIEDHECEGCHTIADAEAARGCRECHPAAASEEEAPGGCLECHDDPEYVPGLVSHGELIEIEGHECEGCHAIRTVADAYHTNCSACHLETAPERFADRDGKPLCRACHLK